MQQELNKALTEVRKAYRLLYDYQSKVLDVMDFIGSSFKKSYYGGFPKYSNASPKTGKGSLNSWAFDWLNMYYYEFHFNSEKINEDTIAFSVFLVSDTGYFLTKNENKDALKKHINAYETPENSETKLIFVVGKNKWKSEGVFTDNWNKPAFVLGNEGQEGENNEIMIFKSYPLANFGNPEMAISQLKNFEQYCTSFGIDFKLQEKVIK